MAHRMDGAAQRRHVTHRPRDRLSLVRHAQILSEPQPRPRARHPHHQPPLIWPARAKPQSAVACRLGSDHWAGPDQRAGHADHAAAALAPNARHDHTAAALSPRSISAYSLRTYARRAIYYQKYRTDQRRPRDRRNRARRRPLGNAPELILLPGGMLRSRAHQQRRLHRVLGCGGKRFSHTICLLTWFIIAVAPTQPTQQLPPAQTTV